ncbi:MAG TPA: hypothetical protein VF723_17615 [Pyrinomonadaceae bacterium]|jgi:hypothetical protein
MLLDEFLPRYDMRERHRTKVRASADVTYAAIRRLDISEARFSMLLFRLRGLAGGSFAAPPGFNLDDFLQRCFILLGERPNEELLLGLVGRFWTASGGLRRLDREGYRSFDERGYAKAAWNFSLSESTGDSVLLETETRVYCLDEASRKRFRLYWTFIGAFSGLIRREILQCIKRTAERSGAA